jgi:hypothetical protein
MIPTAINFECATFASIPSMRIGPTLKASFLRGHIGGCFSASWTKCLKLPPAVAKRSSIARSGTAPDSCVAQRAEIDWIIAFSACPQYLLPINDLAMQPTEAHVEGARLSEARPQTQRDMSVPEDTAPGIDASAS